MGPADTDGCQTSDSSRRAQRLAGLRADGVVLRNGEVQRSPRPRRGVRGFLDNEITPRFPDGLTLLKGDGQFRGEDGTIVKEDSFVLILLYPVESFGESSMKIDAIRDLYKTQFQQESVLRVDERWAVRVSF